MLRLFRKPAVAARGNFPAATLVFCLLASVRADTAPQLAHTQLPALSRQSIDIPPPGGTFPDFPDDPTVLGLRARFTLPDAEEVIVPAFFFQDYSVDEGAQRVEKSGDPVYRVRYTPPVEGTYIAQVEISEADGPYIPLGDPMPFTVGPPAENAAGFILSDPENPRYFRTTQSRRPVWIFGVNAYFRSLLETAPGSNLWVIRSPADDPDLLYTRYAAHRDVVLDAVDNKISAIRIRLDSWWLPLEYDHNWPGVVGFTLGRYDPGHAWIVDRLLDLAEAHGLAVQLCTWNPNTYVHWKRFSEGINEKDPAYHIYARDEANDDLIRRRLRYQAARWSHSSSLFLWELFNEIGYDWNDTEDFDIHNAYWQSVISDFRALDPNGRPVTNSRVGVDTKDLHIYLNPNNNQDFLNATKLPELPQPWGTFDDSDPRPFVMSEYGLSGGDTQNFSGDTDAHRRHSAREGLWLGLVTGKSGALFWRYYHVFDGDVYPPMAAFLKGEDLARRPWESLQVQHVAGPGGLHLRGMIGDPARVLLCVIRTTSRSATDQNHANGNTYRLPQIPPGAYRVEWWNPNNGAKVVEEGVTADDEGLILNIPDGVTRLIAAKIVPVPEEARRFGDWIYVAGASLEPDDQLPNAAPGGDGIANLLKYAAGIDPETPAEGGELFQIKSTKGSPRLRLRVNENALDLTYQWQISENLEHWADWSPPSGTLETLDNHTTWRVVDLVDENDLRFFRYKIKFHAP